MKNVTEPYKPWSCFTFFSCFNCFTVFFCFPDVKPGSLSFTPPLHLPSVRLKFKNKTPVVIQTRCPALVKKKLNFSCSSSSYESRKHGTLGLWSCHESRKEDTRGLWSCHKSRKEDTRGLWSCHESRKEDTRGLWSCHKSRKEDTRGLWSCHESRKEDTRGLWSKEISVHYTTVSWCRCSEPVLVTVQSVHACMHSRIF